jgi:hypothetical protein
LKRFALSLSFAVAIAALSSAVAMAAPPNITGNWTIEQSGPNGTTSSVVGVTQTANAIVGKNAKNGNGFTGTFVTDSQINGKWNGAGGAGWITVFVSPNGHSLNGTWGYNGRKSNASFVGNMILPPIKITTAGNWDVHVVTGPTLLSGPMSCKESGPTSVCTLSGITLNGKFRTSDKVRYTWTSKTQNGWYSFWFNDDGQSFNGIWGYGAASDTSPVMGRSVGQRQGPPARM